jgi:glucose/arabinose dehydrogenase
MENPRVFFVPAVSPSSIIFYTGDQFPAWKNSLVVGELTSRRLQVIMFNQPSQAERRVDVLAELGVRVRDVKQGPDGNLYVATELGFGGSEDGTVLRIEPAR